MMLKTLVYSSLRAQRFTRKKFLFFYEHHSSYDRSFFPYSVELRHYTPYTSIEEQCEDIKANIEEKLIYNSLLHKMGFLQRKRIEKLEKRRAKSNLPSFSIPVSLKYIAGTEVELSNEEENNVDENEGYLLNFPYQVKSVKGNIFADSNDKFIEISNEENDYINERVSDHPSQFVGNWMNDYEKYSEESIDNDLMMWSQDYGTPNRIEPVSKVPCGGCGALLHCRDPSIPGYLPSEIYGNCSEKDLREIVCQRCHFLKNYNTALSVSVDPNDYPRILSQIKDKKALVILIADVTDLPCSIWPGIVDIIGASRPLFLVGNKIDLIPGDRKGWTQHVHSYLRSCLPNGAAVHHTALISAKTGYGVEELINKLHNFWQYKGDVYLVGCTNVGKSSLFNALLQSDYCKVKAVDLLQRATTAPWPGTTLNLLKFPILRPEGWRLYLRTQRLIKERKLSAHEKKLMNQQKNVNEKKIYPQLLGHIGRTFFRRKPENEVNTSDNFSSGTPGRFGLNPNDPDFATSKWLYDTPGVLTHEQFLDLLTTEEVTLTVPDKIIVPRTYVMRVGWTLFIAGLVRMDYLKGSRNIKVTIFAVSSLPVTIIRQDDAEEVYKALLGTKYMVVPQGPEERLQQWPGLELTKEVNLIGKHSQEACADVTLSSAGWVAIAPYAKDVIKMSFWTPKGRGVHVRTPSLLPNCVALRGKKFGKLPAYQPNRASHEI